MLITGPMTRLLTRRTLRTVLGLLLLVEAVFVAESFTTILERVIRNGGTAWDVGWLIALKMPEVVDFALPLTLLLGLFFAITGARDDNELVICATAGVPWYRIPAFATVIGMLALTVSLVFSGVLTPLSAFAARLSLFDLETALVMRQLREPGGSTIIRSLEDQTVIATPSDDPEANRGNLFVYKPDPGGGWRVNQADDWGAVGPDEAGTYVVRLRRFRESSGSASDTAARTDQPGGLRHALPGLSVSVSAVTLDIQGEELIRVADRALRGSELTLLRLAARALRGDGAGAQAAAQRLGEITARALLCPIAALLAVAAAAWAATRSGQLAALPGAIVLLLGLDLLGRWLLGDGAALGGPWPGLAATLFALAGIGGPLAYILHRGELIVTPPRGAA